MLPKQHLAYGTLVALLLFFLVPQVGVLEAAVFLFFTFFIDVDHYFVYVIRNGDLSLTKALKYFDGMRKKYALNKVSNIKTPTLIFHIWEFLILILVLSFFFPILIFGFFGLVFHVFLDFIDMRRMGVLTHRDYFYITRVIRRKFFARADKKYTYI